MIGQSGNCYSSFGARQSTIASHCKSRKILTDFGDSIMQ